MTLDILNKVIKENNIPKDVHLLSDSRWECDPTEMDGIFYHRGSNTIVFTQRGINSEYEQSDEWEILYDPELIKLEGLEVYPVTTSRDYDVTEAFKKAIKEAGDFENYYGIHETEEAYDMIDLRRPLFYCIKIKENFIGYIGFNGNETTLEPEIYIFEQYRNKGYGARVLKKFIDIVFTDGIVKEWREEMENRYIWKKKMLFPSKFVATVRVENMCSRQMMKACGFNENKEVGKEFFGYARKDNEIDLGLIEVVEYNLTKNQYLNVERNYSYGKN